jgi:hypothetical protein
MSRLDDLRTAWTEAAMRRAGVYDLQIPLRGDVVTFRMMPRDLTEDEAAKIGRVVRALAYPLPVKESGQ